MQAEGTRQRGTPWVGWAFFANWLDVSQVPFWASALCSSPYCGPGQGCGFFQTSRCIFLPEFWELERLGKPVNKDLAGDQGLQDC